MAHTIGFYLEENTFHLAEITGKAQKFKVLQYLQESFENKQELIQKLKKHQKLLNKSKIALGLPISSCLFRTFNVPYTDPAKVAQIVAFEAENHVHPHAAEDLILEHDLLSNEGKNSKVAIYAIVKTVLKETLQTLEQAGINPEIVTPDALALHGVLHQFPQFLEKKQVMAVYAGKKQSRVLSLSNKKITQIRTLRFGYEEPDYQERLIRELQRASLSLSEPLQELGILGASEEIVLSLKNAHEELSCNVVALTPQFQGTLDENALKEVAWIPLFLAQALLVKEKYPVNFRKGAFARDRLLAVIKTPLICSLSWIIILFVLCSVYFQKNIQRDFPYLLEINKRTKAVAQKYKIDVEGKSILYSHLVKRALRNRLDEILYTPASKNKTTDTLPVFKIWKNSFKTLLPLFRDFNYFRLNLLLIDQNKYILKAETNASSNVDQLVSALGKLQELVNVRLSGAIEPIAKTEHVRFQISAEVSFPAETTEESK
jgi:hypothetical protein